MPKREKLMHTCSEEGEFYSKFPNRSQLLIKIGQAYWSLYDFKQLNIRDEKLENSSIKDEHKKIYLANDGINIPDLKRYAKRIYENEVQLYLKKRLRDSDLKVAVTLSKDGTLQDRAASLNVLIDASPLHNLEALELFLQMFEKSVRREYLLALTSLEEVFTKLLPDKRQLRTFEEHKFKPLFSADYQSLAVTRDEFDRTLIAIYFEAMLRVVYARFIDRLEYLCKDPVTGIRKRVIETIYRLSLARPEARRRLLSLHVNKLGDTEPKLVAGTVLHLLRQLIRERPSLVGLVCEEVERFIFRPHQQAKPIFYAVCFLSRVVFRRSDPPTVPAQLVAVYLTLFRRVVDAGEIESRLVAVLLSGLARAHPYARLAPDHYEASLGAIYRIVHVSNFNVAVQALSLLYHVTDPSQLNSDRFYSALYKKMSDTSLLRSTKQPLFLNILYKSIRHDIEHRRQVALIKRLLQVCLLHQPPFIAGSLLLIGRVVAECGATLLRLRPINDAGAGPIGVKKEEDWLKKECPDEKPVPVLISNVVATNDDQEFFADIRSSDDESVQNFPKTPKMSAEGVALHRRPSDSSSVSSDGEAGGAKGRTKGAAKPAVPLKKRLDALDGPLSSEPLLIGSSWVHGKNLRHQNDSKTQTYDPLHRNPLHCGALSTCHYELTLLVRHAHPTVALYAQRIMDGVSPASADAVGDPLVDFTTMRFLDRFVHRNPKRLTIGTASSEADPAHSTVDPFIRRAGLPHPARLIPVDSEAFTRRNVDDVPPDERFFHQFYTTLAQLNRGRPKKRAAGGGEISEDSSVSDAEFDAYLGSQRGEKSKRRRGVKRPIKDEDEDEDGDFAEADQSDDDSSSDNEDDKSTIIRKKQEAWEEKRWVGGGGGSRGAKSHGRGRGGKKMRVADAKGQPEKGGFKPKGWTTPKKFQKTEMGYNKRKQFAGKGRKK